jgi:hypothetical protein
MGSSTSTAATSALRNKSRDRRSCTFAGLYGFLRFARANFDYSLAMINPNISARAFGI